MVRRAERANDHRPEFCGIARTASARMDAGRLENLLVRHIGQDSRQAPGAERLARARRTDQQKVVGASGRYLERTLDPLHPHHVLEIGNIAGDRQAIVPRHSRSGGYKLQISTFQKLDTLPKRIKTDIAKTFHQRSLGGIRPRDYQDVLVVARQAHRNGQNPSYRFQEPVQRQFPDKDEAFDFLNADLAGRHKHPYR